MAHRTLTECNSSDGRLLKSYDKISNHKIATLSSEITYDYSFYFCLLGILTPGDYIICVDRPLRLPIDRYMCILKCRDKGEMERAV
jgi:hypothetical protein